MCGIAGLYSFEARVDRLGLRTIAQDMAQALAMRGPDSGDVWQDPDLPLILGHRRLSVLDVSSSGAQPMESDSERYVIVYNGEIYNFKALRRDLESGHGAVFRGESDTEVLLAAIEAWGVSGALQKINGMFAFALWDRKVQSLTLARDRMGKKPLYAGWAGSNFVFGSELKALCAHPEFRLDVDRGALTSYMRFGYVPAPLCIYEQVWKVPAGGTMALDMRMLRSGQDLRVLMEHYWSHKDALMAARDNPIVETGGVVDDFEALLSDCVRERMVSDVPLGAFLSGGIDSSSVVALMQKHAGAAVKTYSIGFEESGFNEADYAREVAAHLGTDHHEMYVSAGDAREVVPDLPTIFDEPFADVSAIPTFLVSKFARRDVTVALSGDGGDEMLGGYNRHVSGPKAWRMAQNIPAYLRGPLGQIITSVPPSFWDGIRSSRPQFGAHMHKFADILSKICEGDVYMRLVSRWDRPKDFVREGQEAIIPLVDPDLQIERLGFAESMMYWDALSYLNGDVLTKVDRASMAVSLEVRSPLLDRRVYDYVWRLPLDCKIRDGTGKWLLRQVLKRHVPEALFERPKQGFGVPVGDWMRGDLRDWAEDLLDEGALRDQGFLDYRQVRALWDAHQKGRGNYADRLWTVLMFQAWYKQWGTRS